MGADILAKIVAVKKREIAENRQKVAMASLEAAIAHAPPPRDFLGALAGPGPIRLIAEVKKASPSAGVIRADFDPAAIALAYAAHGARCISVLTDEEFFQGSLDYLRTIRASVAIPLLRKDFVIDAYQVLEARAAGADAVLLIAECLDDCQLRSLHNLTIDLGMAPLVEIYAPENLPRVIAAGAALIGVNNRDLRTFQVDLGRVLELRRVIPESATLVAESGIHSRADVLRLQEAGVDAMLVGESLMRAPDIGGAVDRLLGRAS